MITLFFESPISASANLEPRMFSMWVSESLMLVPVARLLRRLTCTPAVALAKVIVSMPLPPSTVLVPVPASIVSLPEPPVMVSLPAPPISVDWWLLPTIVSSPAVPITLVMSFSVSDPPPPGFVSVPAIRSR